MGSVIDYIVSRLDIFFKAPIQMTGTRATHALMGRLQELHIPIMWFRADELRANEPWYFFFFFSIELKPASNGIQSCSAGPSRRE
jgi:hypothetical protein